MALQDEMIGNWSGDYALWFEPGEPVSRSTSLLTVGQRPEGVLFEYDWVFDDKPQTGTYLVRPEGSIAFVDSLHTSGSVMDCTPNSVLDVTGTYEAEGQVWKWRTRIEMPSPDELLVTAWNVEPDGEEVLATQARYRRA
jgi:hypothetical protein